MIKSMFQHLHPSSHSRKQSSSSLRNGSSTGHNNGDSNTVTNSSSSNCSNSSVHRPSILSQDPLPSASSKSISTTASPKPRSTTLTPTPRKPSSHSPSTRSRPTRYSYSFMADLDSLDTTVFDAIILGTGFTQTIVAAALAREGKTVLHLDENDYYGGESGAFGLKDLLTWADKVAVETPTGEAPSEDADKIEFAKLVAKAYDHLEIQLYSNPSALGGKEHNIDLVSIQDAHKNASLEDRTKALQEHITAAYTGASTKESKEAIQTLAGWAAQTNSAATASNFRSITFSQIASLEELIKSSRKYNFDLSPKLLYSRGPLTNLLISSGIGKYLEFKLLERTAVYESLTDKVEMMPTSKEDVFVSKALSLKEKRLLMKFLQFAVDYENQMEVWEDYKNAPFTQFVQRSYGLTDKVLTAVVYAIGFDGNDNATTTEGLKSVKVYLQSLGRYGNSAYLCPLYGVGSELAQAFCRVSAVYGGIYMLQHGLKNHNVDQEANQWKSVVDHTGQVLKGNQLICTREYLSRDMDAYLEARISYVSHCILVTDRSAFGETTLCKTLFPMGSLVLNPGETPERKNEHTISVLQMCGGTMSCPADRFILYIWAESDSLKGSAKEALTAAIRKLAHIPGDALSLKAPTTAAASSSAAAVAGEESKPVHNLDEAPPMSTSLSASVPSNTTAVTSGSGTDGIQPRMSLDQEMDMETVRQEILKAEKKLFDESNESSTTTPVPSRPSTPAPPGSSGSTSSSKPLSKMFQKSKSAGSLTTTPLISPVALLALFYKRTTSWPRVPYPIGSEKLKPLPENLTLLKPMDHSLDFEEATEEARAIFERLCPGAEFLPPTPEPEDNSSY